MSGKSENLSLCVLYYGLCALVKRCYAIQIEKQICQSVVANLKYQLSSAEISKKNEAEAKESLGRVLESLDYEKTKQEQESKFQAALKAENYFDVLRVFNEKNIVGMIGEYFRLKNDAYCSTVLALLNGQLHDEIVNALAPYLPTEIPR